MTPQMKTDAEQLRREWQENPRWKGITRAYSAEDVVRLRGSVRIEYSLARRGAEKFWQLLHTEPVVAGLGAVTGNQAFVAVVNPPCALSVCQIIGVRQPSRPLNSGQNSMP